MSLKTPSVVGYKTKNLVKNILVKYSLFSRPSSACATKHLYIIVRGKGDCEKEKVKLNKSQSGTDQTDNFRATAFMFLASDES